MLLLTEKEKRTHDVNSWDIRASPAFRFSSKQEQIIQIHEQLSRMLEHISKIQKTLSCLRSEVGRKWDWHDDT